MRCLVLHSLNCAVNRAISLVASADPLLTRPSPKFDRPSLRLPKRWKLPAKKRLDHTGKLSRRERRVVELVAQGLKNREIATELGIGVFVVRNYLGAIYDKIGLSNRVELALWYWARKQEGSSFP